MPFSSCWLQPELNMAAERRKEREEGERAGVFRRFSLLVGRGGGFPGSMILPSPAKKEVAEKVSAPVFPGSEIKAKQRTEEEKGGEGGRR